MLDTYSSASGQSKTRSNVFVSVSNKMAAASFKCDSSFKSCPPPKIRIVVESIGAMQAELRGLCSPALSCGKIDFQDVDEGSWSAFMSIAMVFCIVCRLVKSLLI